jgi:tetratricopeptide (TPR) repeat protein
VRIESTPALRVAARDSIREGIGISDPVDLEQELPSPDAVTVEQPSPALRAVATGAEQRINAAFSLAQRGAVYSARTEFIGAVRMISEALDAQSATERRSQALAQAMRALQEVEDFAPRGWQAAGEIDLAHVVSGHRTPVLKETDLTSFTPLLASQRYYTFAQEQFAAAVKPVPAGSHALYGLGKLQAAMPSSGSDAQTLATARAMVFYQAALLVDSRNFMAANELGVLLARMGQWQDAREVLRHGVAVGPRPELWRNLSRVHQALGESFLAECARHEAVRAERQPQRPAWPAHLGNGGGFVRWVSPQELGRSSGGDTAVPQSSPPAPAPPPPSPGGISAWLPWSTEKR